jgi:3-oxoacyl-[acyl-carrier protein] reductase
MDISLKDKNVLVTGAATGIGKAIAIAFSAAGARVFVNHLEQTAAAQLMMSKGHCEQHYSADVSSKSSVVKMVSDISKEYGAVDILVNNAGISYPKPFLEISEEEWEQTLNVNLKGAMLCSQAVIPDMLEKGEGVIINIVSELGYLGREKFCAYTASKGALITLTRSLAREFAPIIRVNGIAPGPVMTDMLKGEIKTEDDLKKEMDIPMQRVGEPNDIAASAVFLASDYARFYCGDILSPNGGALMR